MSNLCYSFKDETQHIADIYALRYKADVMEIISSIVPEHGGKIEIVDALYFCISFPKGARKQELYPRLYSVHYEITFPDSFTIYEVITRDGISTIQFPLKIFPEELQMKYGLL